MNTTRCLCARGMGMIVAGCVLFAGWGLAGAKEPGELGLATERVVVFKDGYGLFVKSAEGFTNEKGEVFTEQVPDRVVLGCFWAVPDDQRILSMRAERVEVRGETRRDLACLTILDLLRANEGRQVILELQGQGEEISGQIVDVLERPAKAGESIPAAFESAAVPGMNPPAPGGSIDRNPFGEQVRLLPPEGGELVWVETTDEANLILPVRDIRRIRSAEDLETSMTLREEHVRRSKRLIFDFGPEIAHQKVTFHLVYFTEGLRWIPTYRLDGDLETEALLTLQGEILNEVENIEGAALELVVGVPNFRFKNEVSPLTLEKNLRRTLTRDPRQPSRPQLEFSNALMSQAAIFDDRGGGAPQEAAPALAPELAAEPSMDLFTYSLDRFSLRKGGRAAVRLWESTTEIQHLYTLDYRVRRDARGEDEYYPNHSPGEELSPLRLQWNRVWHQLELTNASTVPWTTGAVFLLRNGLPLGQDLLTYTSRGAKTLVPVTVAVDVRADHEDKELERRPNALRYRDHDFILVRSQGTFTLTNRKDEAIEMRVRLAAPGRVTQASDDAEIRIRDFDLQDWLRFEGGPWYSRFAARASGHSDVEWNLTLQPGESKTLTYECEYYI